MQLLAERPEAGKRDGVELAAFSSEPPVQLDYPRLPAKAADIRRYVQISAGHEGAVRLN
jgi:hypothetical protein